MKPNLPLFDNRPGCNMDFQARLLKVGNDLRKEEVRALVFLCSDILGCNPAAVQSAGDLFSRLSDQDHLSEERPHLLVELLGIIQRTKLLRDHNLPRTGAQDLISPYRKLLYSLSEELTADDLKNIKFLLNNKLPRGKLEGVTTLEVFMELEHRALISDTDLGFLESIIQPVCPVLLEKINQFNAQNSAMNHGLVAQETGRPIAEMDPQPPTETGGAVINDQDESEDGSPALSASRAENNSRASANGNLSIVSVSEADADAPLHICNCHPVKSDTSVIFPQENQTSSRAETSVTGSADAVSMKTRTQKFWCCRPWAVLIFLCRAWKRIS
ncbi:hypothetical protein fugu_000014 [Takifugu bimaculatus]|uniref:DED domain-containing protein n=1 Tax=Takifugu bimaculatus TaxID=433685 RepID=A0A4Z2CFR6_9TELE|nr:hypothetical protein fugu_000014 [Takifugu bimaculatus]